MLGLFASLMLPVAFVAVWWVRRQRADQGRRGDATTGGSTWSGLEAEVDGIRFDRSKERIELWRRTP